MALGINLRAVFWALATKVRRDLAIGCGESTIRAGRFADIGPEHAFAERYSEF